MCDRKTSGVLHDRDFSPQAPGAAPGGPSPIDTRAATTAIVRPPRHTLQFLVALITQNNRSQP